MSYLLKGMPLFGVFLLAFAGALRAQLPEQAPLSLLYAPGQLQGETNIGQLVQTPSGQIIAAGERLGYYTEGRWDFLPEPRKPAIRSLCIDQDYLWVTSLNEIGRIRLPLHAGSRYEKLSLPGTEEAGDFWHIGRFGDDLIATTNQSVWIINLATYATKELKIANRGRLVMVNHEGRPVVTNGSTPPREIKQGQALPVTSPLPDPNDKLWVGAGPGWVATAQAVYVKEGDHYKVLARYPDTPKDFRRIYSAAIAWENRIVLATFNQGLLLIDRDTGRIDTVTNATALPSFATVSLLADKANRLWVGTNKGISLLESPRFGHGVATKDTAAFAFRQDGIFISYSDHGEYLTAQGQQRTDSAYRFLQTGAGPVIGLWGKVLLGSKEIALSNSNTGVLAELPNGNLLAASGARLYHVDRQAGRAAPLATITQEPSGIVTLGNQVWVATFDGALHRSPLTPDFAFSKVTTLPNNAAATLHKLGDTLISATASNVYFGEQFREVANTADLHTPRLATTADGTLWLLAEQAREWRLGRLRRTSDGVTWETVEAKGLSLLPEVHAFSASGDLVMICGGNSIIELNTRELKPAYRLGSPRLQFTFTDPATDSPTTADAPPSELSASRNSLTFTGTLPFDEFGERPKMERRLLPTDTAWVPTKSGEKVAYPALSSDDYTLEIRTTHLGRTGATVRHPFRVLVPWYWSRTAIGGYAVGALLLSFAGYRLRTHQIRQRNAELERIVAQRTKALAEASAAKTEFLASMSHEIRNPMNGVIGLVNILREQQALPKQANTLRLLHGCAEQLRSTVDDILDFSKIEARKVGVDISTFDLLDTLEAAAATVDPSGGSITFADKPPSGLSLRGDAAKLRQIFANYLTNAIKYGVPPAARVSTILTPDGDDLIRLTLSVTSTGPTIEKDKLDKLFESFTRGEDAIERNIRGTGLGLAICKRFAEAMGGEVGAVSTNGETTFYINVPFEKLSVTAAAPVASAVALGSHHPMTARALAIEDEDYNRIVLGDILAKMNYTVDWATTGAEALQLARENGYDIILTDYRLPDTNGVDLTKQILKLCPDPKPAVFAVTAYSTRERREECMNAGMSGFISKPITLEKLRTTIYSWGDRQLTKISLEASSRPVRAVRRSAEIENGWSELKRIASVNTKQAAEHAHRLNNLCRATHQIDIAEQLELLEGALERHEPTGQLVTAIERLLRA